MLKVLSEIKGRLQRVEVNGSMPAVPVMSEWDCAETVSEISSVTWPLSTIFRLATLPPTSPSPGLWSVRYEPSVRSKGVWTTHQDLLFNGRRAVLHVWCLKRHVPDHGASEGHLVVVLQLAVAVRHGSGRPSLRTLNLLTSFRFITSFKRCFYVYRRDEQKLLPFTNDLLAEYMGTKKDVAIGAPMLQW